MTSNSDQADNRIAAGESAAHPIQETNAVPTEAAAVIVKPRRLSEKELALVKDLTSKENIEVIVPNDIDPKEWQKTTDVVCRALGKAQAQEKALLPVLGRLLVVAKQRKEIWKSEGYSTWGEFLEAEIYPKFDVGRSTCYEAMTIADRWGSLPPEAVVEIPRQSFKVLNKAIGEGKEHLKQARDLVEAARTMTVAEFEQHCVSKSLIESGETTGATISFTCNKTQKRQLEAFWGNADYQAKIGSSDKAKMVLTAIVEATTEWNQQEGVSQ